jgi:hypothetical protein
MKHLRDYITESKKTYSFKVKVAGDLPEKFESTLKGSLEKWKVLGMSKSTTPIQQVPLDFPQMENQVVHIFEVTLEYPVTDNVLLQYVVEKTNISAACIRVRNSNDPLEDYNKPEEKAYIVKLGSELENPNPEAQDTVGEKHILSFLSSISKDRAGPTEVKGINNELLAKKAPSEKANIATSTSEVSKSLIGGKTLSDPKGIRK